MLATEPQRDAAMSLCLEAWGDLDTCRPLGFAGAGPIPFTAVLEWARWRRLDRDMTDVLVQVIRHLDVRRMERIESERTLDRIKTKGSK